MWIVFDNAVVQNDNWIAWLPNFLAGSIQFVILFSAAYLDFRKRRRGRESEAGVEELAAPLTGGGAEESAGGVV